MSGSRSEFEAWWDSDPTRRLYHMDRHCWAAWQASRRAAFEQAAKVCDSLEDGEEQRWAAERCAKAIRAIMKKARP